MKTSKPFVHGGRGKRGAPARPAPRPSPENSRFYRVGGRCGSGGPDAPRRRGEKSRNPLGQGFIEKDLGAIWHATWPPDCCSSALRPPRRTPAGSPGPVFRGKWSRHAQRKRRPSGADAGSKTIATLAVILLAVAVLGRIGDGRRPECWPCLDDCWTLVEDAGPRESPRGVRRPSGRSCPPTQQNVSSPRGLLIEGSFCSACAQNRGSECRDRAPEARGPSPRSICAAPPRGKQSTVGKTFQPTTAA